MDTQKFYHILMRSTNALQSKQPQEIHENPEERYSQITAQAAAVKYVSYVKGQKAKPIPCESHGRSGINYTMTVRTEALPEGESFELFTTFEERKFRTYFEKGQGMTKFDMTMRGAPCYINFDGLLLISRSSPENHFSAVMHWCASVMRLKHTGSSEGFRLFDDEGAFSVEINA